MRAAMFALAASSALFVAPPALGARGVPCGFYGIDPGAPVDAGEVILDDDHAKRLARAGAGAVRVEFLLDDAEAWDDDKLEQYDAIIDAARAAGLEPVGLLSHRTIGEGQDVWNDDPDRDGDNAYVEAFAETAEALMTRYAGDVVQWEIWSQPNCSELPDPALDPEHAGCTFILPRVLAQILAQIRIRNEALFNVDELSLTTGGLLASDDAAAPFSGVDYLRELYAQPVWDELEARFGERTPWSRLGQQLFFHQGTEVDPVTLNDYLDALRDLADEEGDESPFAVTGMAWSSALAGEELQAANLTTSFDVLSEREDVAGVVWASFQDAPLDEQPFGLVDEAGVEKLALAAFSESADNCEPTEQGGGTGSGGGGSGSSGGGVAAGSPPGTSGQMGRPIDGKRRASSCSYAAGATSGGGTRSDGGWLALFAIGAIAMVRCRRVV
ncbi:hypothetical protein WMF45_00405 [Sorangium sp. So ce448]|uniref:hypothetical protein n=1 Tax=Sorangium sp. So ce448 TaxID=3133314 RepID=UPI003F5DCBD6